MGLFSWFSRKKKNEEAVETAPAVEKAVAEEAPAPAASEAPKAAPAPKAEPKPAAAPEAPKAAPAPKAEPKPAAAPEASKTAPTPKAEPKPAAAPEAPKTAPAPKAEPKPAAAPEAPKAAPAPKAEPKPAAAPAVAEPAPAPVTAAGKTIVGKNEDVVVRVVKVDKPETAVEPAPKAEPKPAEEGPKVYGKYEFDLAPDGYRFYLVANNGQLLYESIGFTTMEGATVGIDTFRRAVEGGNFAVISDKYNRYRYVLNRKYYGENYSTRAQCEKCVESVKRFAPDAVISEFTPTEEQIATFTAAKASLRTVKDVDWDAVEAAEAAATKMGKFEISREADKEYRFYLVANNGQVLYTGKNYQKLCQCLAGIKSFKRAVYVGNFSIDQDKFGRFRYILKNIGVAPAFMGESYTTRKQCESSIESVKNFVVTAEIEMPTGAEE